MLLTVVAGAIETFAISALFPLFSAILGTDVASGGPLLRWLDDSVASLPFERINVALALYLVAVPMNVLSKMARTVVTADTSARITNDVKQRVFARLLEAPLEYVLTKKQGDLVYRLSTAPHNLATALVLVAQTAHFVVHAVFITLLLFTIEWRVTLLMVALGAIFFALNRTLASTVSIKAGQEMRSALSAAFDVVAEFVSGVKEITASRAGEAWGSRFRAQGDLYRRFYVRSLVVAATPGLAMEFAILALAGIVAASMRIAFPDQFLSLLPVMAVYVYAVRQLIGSVSFVSQNLLRVTALSVDVELLRVAHEETYPVLREGRRDDIPDWQELRLEHVSFTYHNRSDPALRDVSLTIRRGQTLAVAGPSGAGKSTVLYLLLRLFDPTAGRLTLDGADLHELRRDAWLDRIAYVSQEGFLYNGTVAENISFGQSFSREEIAAAARAAQADDFIRELPMGYDTLVGDRGSALSAGQRQRIAIARALVRRPEMLLLDEVTSALDSASEALIQRTLSGLRGRCTIVIVAHRLSTIRDADTIVLIDQGTVVDRGRHEDLVERSRLYAEMARLQELTEQVVR